MQFVLTPFHLLPAQVDVTAAEAAPGKIPAVNTAAAGQVKQATGMINTALQHMGLGPDPWKAITVGVMPAKPHTAVRFPRLYRTLDIILLAAFVLWSTTQLDAVNAMQHACITATC